MTNTKTNGTPSEEPKDRIGYAISYYNELAINSELRTLLKIQENTIEALQTALEAYRRIMYPEAKRSFDRYEASKT